MKVSLFATCLTDTFYPRTGIAAVKVLEHLGCAVDFPQEQTCCGQPLYNNGYESDARELARRMINVFEQSQYVVTPSGSCAAMIRDYYTALLADNAAYRDAAVRLGSRTYEFVEFLTKVLKVDIKAMGVMWPGKATYHYSCHLRGIGIKDEAAQLMQQIEGLEYIPMDKVDQCCGFGGTFAMKYAEISGAMVRDKVACIRQTQAETVISNDAGCTMNISGACRRQNCQVGFKSLAEVIAEGLGLLQRVET